MKTKKTNTSRKLKVVNRRRFFTSMFLILVLCSTLFISLAFADSNSPKQYVQITVASGDTIWSIASEFNYKYFENQKDIRKIIHYINLENQINSNLIYPGDQILIPSEI
ncbi:MAG: LysM peptidoglycan-binding domain-containing protein [Acidaminobacteraceae bacterium]